MTTKAYTDLSKVVCRHQLRRKTKRQWGLDSSVSCPLLCKPTILAKPGKTWYPKLNACNYVGVQGQMSEIQERRNV